MNHGRGDLGEAAAHGSGWVTWILKASPLNSAILTSIWVTA